MARPFTMRCVPGAVSTSGAPGAPCVPSTLLALSLHLDNVGNRDLDMLEVNACSLRHSLCSLVPLCSPVPENRPSPHEMLPPAESKGAAGSDPSQARLCSTVRSLGVTHRRRNQGMRLAQPLGGIGGVAIPARCGSVIFCPEEVIFLRSH